LINKKTLKKFFIYFSASLALATTLSFLYVFFPKLPDSFDNRLRDFLFNVRGEISNSNSVVIVDIDEKSLQSLGQWPWSRNKIAQVVQNLAEAQAAIIGFDVVFPENDKSSPHKVLKELNIKHENAPNYDDIFAQVVASTPTILGYQFELEDKEHVNDKVPNIPAIFIERNKNTDANYLIKAYGTILNIPQIQDNSYSSGFFNNIPDDSGIIRSVPLIISYDDAIYPSLSLELLRVATQTERVYVNYDEQGVNTISLNGIEIPTDRHGRLLINFRGKEGNFPYISALDIYKNDFKKEDIEGKIILIGTSAAGLLDLRATPFEAIYPGVEVHANAIDNIIEGDLLEKNGVAVVPGLAFGTEGYFRFSFATDLESIQEGIRRIEKFVKENY
jgi:adenylate cyclase